jgi:hypothetical protein
MSLGVSVRAGNGVGPIARARESRMRQQQGLVATLTVCFTMFLEAGVDGPSGLTADPAVSSRHCRIGR